MLRRLLQLFEQRSGSFQYHAIQLTSIKRSYLERRDKNRFRELAETAEEFKLSPTQVMAATSHAKETLVVAGAGSRKTSVIIGRAKYLVESGRAKEEEILMLAYNKDAAEELSSRTKASSISILAQTFHGFGNSVVKAEGERTGVAFGGKGEVADFLAKHLKTSLDEKSLEDLVRYFSRQMVSTREYGKFKDLSDYATYVRGTIPRTLMNERVKSHGEWLIANYLFTNSIEYKYEAQYDVSGISKERHQPDFTISLPDQRRIYVEYFGIDRHQNTAPGIPRDLYLQGIEWKREVHASNGTDCISLFYYDLIEGNLLRNLEEALAGRNIVIHPKKSDEILARANEVGYQSQFLKVCEQFMNHVRSQRLSIENLLQLAKNDKRSLTFLHIFAVLLKNYETELQTRNLPDFAALIHTAADTILRGEYEFKFSHLLVDEFQDISKDRLRLIEAMKSANPKLQVTCVGDDWQSIYAFSGGDVSIMRAASRPKKNRKRVDLAETYRLPQEIADLSRAFVLKNPLQLIKTVTSRTNLKMPGRVVVHWDTHQGEIAENLKTVISRIGSPANDPEISLRVLARYGDNLPSLRLASSLWQGPVEIGTVHASKGLEADFVIVMDMVQDFRGFPSTIENDPVMSLVMPEQERHQHGEERRLFYVALTRAKQECHLISPSATPSLFTMELLQDGLGEHFGLDESKNHACPMCSSGRILLSPGGENYYCSNSPFCIFNAPRCPICSKPMQWSYQDFPRFQCATHPEIALKSCPACKWGVLVSRRFISKHTEKEESFDSCHTWAKTRCNGK